MIAAQDPLPHFTPEDYFAWEEQQLEKYEYIDGQVYAMSGGTVNHGRIIVHLTSLICGHLDDDVACIIGNSSIRIKSAQSQHYTHPDISVSCDEWDRSTTNYITYPCLIVEVLSPSTEAYDRGGKFRLYRQNPALRDYLLVSSTGIAIDLYHKTDQGQWLLFNYQPDDTVELKSINLSFPIKQVYRKLDLTPEA